MPSLTGRRRSAPASASAIAPSGRWPCSPPRCRRPSWRWASPRSTQDQLNVALPLAVGFWLIGLLFALWAAFPTLRYWEELPQTTRWLGALPMLSVSLFFSAALIAALFV